MTDLTLVLNAGPSSVCALGAAPRTLPTAQSQVFEWRRRAERAPKMTCLAHGEPAAANILPGRINRGIGWQARLPEYLERIELEQPT